MIPPFMIKNATVNFLVLEFIQSCTSTSALLTLGSLDSLGWAAPCTVGCLETSPAFTHWMPVAPPPLGQENQEPLQD